MNTKVKICGIKNLNEIEIINRYPVDYIGFIFTKSKRQISIEQAKVLRSMVRKDIKVVGVFMNESEEFILKAIKDAKLDAVQLHGDNDIDSITRFMNDDSIKEVFKTVAVSDEESIENVAKLNKYCDRILLDTSSGGKSGGTGKCFDWNLIDKLDIKNEIILAGGLNPDNIEKAIKTINPFMVDLNSGLETDLIKDEEKIIRAFDAIKRGNDNE